MIIPPRFHAEYGEYRVKIAIDSLRIINGHIPNAQFRKATRWAASRKSQLHDAWTRCQSDLHPGKIA